MKTLFTLLAVAGALTTLILAARGSTWAFPAVIWVLVFTIAAW